ncbi:MAG: dihydroorotate dehydrogenase-like protein, partial [Dehalococcoidia bacterium]
MADLHTEYLGLELRNPVVLSACPLSEDTAMLRELEDAGIGAVVLRSLFEEQIESEAMELHGLLEEWSDSYLEAQSFFPPLV